MTRKPIPTLISGLDCQLPPADLLQLDIHLFPTGPQPSEVIQVSGGSNCGKTSLTLHLAASALLPRTWRGIRTRGCEAGVLYLDCDLHFSIIQLENIMQKRIKNSLRLGKEALKKKKLGCQFDESLIDNSEKLWELLHSDKTSLKAEIASLVKQCLKSFYYLRCTNSTQYAITLLSLEEYLLEQSGISLVIIDSLSAFTWYDRVYRVRSWTKIKDYYNELFSMVMACIKKYNAVLIATKQILFNKKFSDEEYRDKYRHPVDDSKDEDNEHKEHEDEEVVEGQDSSDWYLGSVWRGSVTRKIVLSILNSPETTVEHTNQNLNNSTSSSKDNTDGSMVNLSSLKSSDHKSSESAGCAPDMKRQLYSADVTVNQKRTKLTYAIHEDGLRWQNG